MSIRYHLGVVVDNKDADKRGRLRVIVPTIFSDVEPLPDWIKPRVLAAGPGAISMFWVPPVDAIVYLEEGAGGELRWLGSELGDLQELHGVLASDYPERAGFTDPTGAHVLAVGADLGFLMILDSGTRLEVDGSRVRARASGTATAYPVVLSTINTPLASALTELLAALTFHGLPAANVVALISALGIGTYDATTLASD